MRRGRHEQHRLRRTAYIALFVLVVVTLFIWGSIQFRTLHHHRHRGGANTTAIGSSSSQSASSHIATRGKIKYDRIARRLRDGKTSGVVLDGPVPSDENEALAWLGTIRKKRKTSLGDEMKKRHQHRELSAEEEASNVETVQKVVEHQGDAAPESDDSMSTKPVVIPKKTTAQKKRKPRRTPNGQRVDEEVDEQSPEHGSPGSGVSITKDNMSLDGKHVRLCLMKRAGRGGGGRTSCEPLRVVLANESQYPMDTIHLHAKRGNIAVEFAQTGTHLSRDINGVVSGDKLDAKALEQWKFEEASGDSTSLCSHPFIIRPAASPFESDVESKCISIEDEKQRRSMTKDTTLLRVQRQERKSGCARFCTSSVQSSQARNKVNGAQDGGDDAHATVVLFSSLMPLSKMKFARGATPDASPNGTPWQRQLAVLESWQRMPKGKNTDNIKFLAYLCVEAADVDKLVKDQPQLFAKTADNGGEDRDVSSKKIAINGECEVHPRFGIPTYRGLFAAAKEFTTARLGNQNDEQLLLMYSNSDILFAASEVATSIEGSLRLLAKTSVQHRHLFISGRRRNCEPTTSGVLLDAGRLPGGLSWPSVANLDGEEEASTGCDPSWRRRWVTCPLFEDTAQDYFIVTADALIWKGKEGDMEEDGDDGPRGRKWNSARHPHPPLVVGGIAFDNWMVSVMNTRQDVLAIDASTSINALHVNHGGAEGLRSSHKKDHSVYNSKLAHEHGGWADGKVTLSPYSLQVVEGKQSAGNNNCRVAAHERRIIMCPSQQVCSVVHLNQDLARQRKPNAFDAPWKRAD